MSFSSGIKEELSRHIGNADTPPKFLKRIHLPSITGRAARGPIFPRPKTAEPSDTTAIILPLDV